MMIGRAGVMSYFARKRHLQQSGKIKKWQYLSNNFFFLLLFLY